jgi:hypothetical protein
VVPAQAEMGIQSFQAIPASKIFAKMRGGRLSGHVLRVEGIKIVLSPADLSADGI